MPCYNCSMPGRNEYENLEAGTSGAGVHRSAFHSSQMSAGEELRPDLFSVGGVPSGVPSSSYRVGPSSEAVLLHAAEPGGKASRWEATANLDQFFARIYEYHQRGGFLCIALSEFLNLLQFLFIAVFTTFLVDCVNYSVLFATNAKSSDQKPTMATVYKQNCPAHLSGGVIVLLVVAAVVWLWKAARAGYQVLQAWEIRSFYLGALAIDGAALDSLTWHDVLQRLCDVQRSRTANLVINQPELSELDVYHRILRHNNYLVALVNKGILPPRITLPFLGKLAFFPNGLRWNVEWLLFHSPWSPWHDYFTLKPAYKSRERLRAATTELQQATLWLGLLNLVLSPLILVWQILYSFFSWSEQIKRDPAALGSRTWSVYGRYYFRHFNELEHELALRLNRAYRPAAQYQDLFVSKLGELIARNLALVAGSVFAVIFALAAWDEDVLRVEHMLTAMTVAGAVAMGCKVFIQDENLVWCPELLLNAVLAHVHYLPDAWKGQAHTDRVRHEFSQLFQFKASFLVEELLSPLITPFVILFYLFPRIPHIVEFYYRFTVEVPGLGDVCSFALMDVGRHGDAKWQAEEPAGKHRKPGQQPPAAPADPTLKAQNGKTEMSLVHFSLANPYWAPPAASSRFLANLRETAERELGSVRDAASSTRAATHQLADNALFASLSGLGVGVGLGPSSNFHLAPIGRGGAMSFLAQGFNNNLTNNANSVATLGPAGPPLIGRGIRKADGPSVLPGTIQEEGSLVRSIHASGLFHSSAHETMGGGGRSLAPLAEGTVNDMSVHALYLHELHQRKLLRGDLGGVNYGALSPDESPLAEEDDEDEDSPVTTAFAPPNLWRVPEQELEPR